MILFTFAIWCRGCASKPGFTAADAKALTIECYAPTPEQIALLAAAAAPAMIHDAGWTTDGSEHFCPQCTIQRRGVSKASEVLAHA